jgi:hypothetical protein
MPAAISPQAAAHDKRLLAYCALRAGNSKGQCRKIMKIGQTTATRYEHEYQDRQAGLAAVASVLAAVLPPKLRPR